MPFYSIAIRHLILAILGLASCFVGMAMPRRLHAQSDGFDAAELAARRLALRERVRQPVLLEAKSFDLYLDRTDGTLRVADRSSSLNWLSAPDRRGFASVLLRGEGGLQRELPIDGLEDLRATGTSVRFRGRSSAGEVPELVFEIAVTRPLVGLEIRVEAPAGFFEGGGAVKLLDRSLWIADADGGGVLLPIGLGEWFPAAQTEAFRRRLSTSSGAMETLDSAVPGDSGEGMPLRPSMGVLGLLRADVGLLLSWDHPDVLIDVAGEAVSDAAFPGTRSIHTTVVLRGGARSVRLLPLGRMRALREVTESCAQLLSYGDPLPSLRYKTGFAPRQREFIGAALFHVEWPRESSSSALDALERAASRLRERLDIDRALFVVRRGDDVRAGTESATALPTGEELARLRRAADHLHRLGHLAGLEVPYPAAGASEALDAIEESLPGVAEQAALDFVFARAVRARGAALARDLWRERPALRATLAERHVLLGAEYLDPAQARDVVLLEGLLDHKASARDGERFYPFVPAVTSTTVRLAPRLGAPLEPHDTDRFLRFLLLGAEPVYALPGTSESGARRSGDASAAAGAPFTRLDDGWGAGRELSEDEAFIKSSYEVLSHLARLRHREAFSVYNRLDAAGLVEEAWFGTDLRVVINRGAGEYEDPEGRFILPPSGFWVQHPFFVAFHARAAFGADLGAPAFFTIRSLEGKLWLRADKVRIWHGFGPSRITLGGKSFDVPVELETRIW